MNTLLRCTLAVSLLALAACAAAPTDEDGPTGDTAQAATCDDVSGTLPERSLFVTAVTDPTIVSRFTFARTMNAIRSSANAAATTNTAVFKTWMKTFGTVAQGGTCDSASVDPNNYNSSADFCPRTPELGLSSLDPFAVGAATTFEPIALVNRFDLAPSNGATCGEYRIVYGMKNGPGRAFIIFEASMPNPHPEQGIAACLPVAQFWQGLSNVASSATRVANLEKFYYAGLPGFEPVVKASHYGLGTNTSAVTPGQIRTNTLISRWLLREFKTHRECTDIANPKTCTLSIKHVTVKNNPANELFDGTNAKSASFRASFVSSIPRLSASTPATISMAISDGFNEFESVSQPNGPADVDYVRAANADMRTAIQTKLTALGSKLTPTDILVRAETQTCAGCHKLSNGASLGGTAGTWPADGFFVQVSEQGALSDALKLSFLPRRKQVLESFINKQCTPAPVAQAADENVTIGGSAVDAPN